MPGDLEEEGGLWFTEILLPFRIRVRELSKSRKCVLLLCMEVICPIDSVDKKLACVCLRCSTDDEVNRCLEQGSHSLQQR